MNWLPCDGGSTIGTEGSESGVIVLDDEHPDGARITLERECSHAPFSVTCGIYGWMFHTRYFSSRAEADAEIEAMKDGISFILSSIPNTNDQGFDAKLSSVAGLITGVRKTQVPVASKPTKHGRRASRRLPLRAVELSWG